MQFKKITNEIIIQLKNIVGETYVLFDSESLEKYGRDETENLLFKPEVVVKPKNTQEVSEILKLANSPALFDSIEVIRPIGFVLSCDISSFTLSTLGTEIEPSLNTTLPAEVAPISPYGATLPAITRVSELLASITLLKVNIICIFSCSIRC